MSARDHFKSTRLYCRVMYNIFRSRATGREGTYYSFKEDMASYHLKKVKEMIRLNPYFADFVDMKPKAESVLSYRYKGTGPLIEYTPRGLFSFGRGVHADDIFIDDPLKDPTDKLDPGIIRRVNHTLKADVFPMVNRGGELRIVGTPQTWEDIFFDKELEDEFVTTNRPAIVDEKNQIALWPEWFSFKRLLTKRRQLGVKLFNQEYMCRPAYSEEAYLDREQVQAAMFDGKNLDVGTDWSKALGNMVVVAGLDIGKKTHPSHLTVYVRFPDKRWLVNPETGKEELMQVWCYRQIHSKWFDGVDYLEQLNYCKLALAHFNISILRYDNTRGEFEGFAEQRLVPRRMEPVTFNTKNKNAMASNLSSVFNQTRIEILNEPRQFNQMLSVNNDLQAMEGPEGHGDSFWSSGLAILGERPVRSGVRSI
jgi:hypothetical protein